jgi:arsenate reductase (thioredoxin)
MKNILFVCTGNSARSIIGESIINHKYKDKYKGFSAGSNPSGKVNDDVKNFLLTKNFDVSNYTSKNFNKFINDEVKMDYVITVCNNANNEVCPIWPKDQKIIHWDIEDPVSKLNKTNDLSQKNNIVELTFNDINKRIENLLNEK